MTHCEKLYNYFLEHPKATADEVMSALDWERRQVSRYKHRMLVSTAFMTLRRRSRS